MSKGSATSYKTGLSTEYSAFPDDSSLLSSQTWKSKQSGRSVARTYKSPPSEQSFKSQRTRWRLSGSPSDQRSALTSRGTLHNKQIASSYGDSERSYGTSALTSQTGRSAALAAKLQAASAFTNSSARGPELKLSDSDFVGTSGSGIPSAFDVPAASSFFDGTAIEERYADDDSQSGTGSIRSGSTRKTAYTNSSKKSRRAGLDPKLLAGSSAFSGASVNRALPLSAANLDMLAEGATESDAGTSLFVPVSTVLSVSTQQSSNSSLCRSPQVFQTGPIFQARC